MLVQFQEVVLVVLVQLHQLLVLQLQEQVVVGVVLDFWVLDVVGGALEERFSWKPVLWIEGGFEPGWGTRWFVRFGW